MDVPIAPQPKETGPCGLLPLVECCCCTRSEPKGAIPRLLLLETTMNPPSLLQQCCFCSFDETRVIAGIDKVPELRGLAGITMQTDGGGAENNVQTLKWAIFDRETREVRTRNVAGSTCCGNVASSQLATWVVGLPWAAGTCAQLCLISCGMSCCHRQCDFQYRFIFDPDWRRADIKCMMNCCPCVPCMPAWCQVPDCLVKFDMVQAEGVSDGTHWHRNSASCGGPMKPLYELKTVFNSDGTPGPFHHLYVERAPRTYYMTR